jgi:hypothetical protein
MDQEMVGGVERGEWEAGGEKRDPPFARTTGAKGWATHDVFKT